MIRHWKLVLRSPLALFVSVTLWHLSFISLLTCKKTEKKKFFFNSLNSQESFLCSCSYYTLICTAEEYSPGFHQYFPSPQTWKTKSVVKAPCFLAPGIVPLRCTSTGHTVLIFFFFSFLTLCKTPYFSDLAWLSYKLLFVRHDPSSITLGGKPSHGRSCHLEADPFSRATDSAPPPPPPGESLFLDLPFYHANPRRTALRLDQTGPARLPWFSINFSNGASHWCLACLSVFKTQIADARGCWIHKRRQNGERSQFTCMTESRPGAAALPRAFKTVLNLEYSLLGCVRAWYLRMYSRGSAHEEMMHRRSLGVLSFSTCTLLKQLLKGTRGFTVVSSSETKARKDKRIYLSILGNLSLFSAQPPLAHYWLPLWWTLNFLRHQGQTNKLRTQWDI